MRSAIGVEVKSLRGRRTRRKRLDSRNGCDLGHHPVTSSEKASVNSETGTIENERKHHHGGCKDFKRHKRCGLGE